MRLKERISWKAKMEADMTAMQLELRMLSAKVEQMDKSLSIPRIPAERIRDGERRRWKESRP